MNTLPNEIHRPLMETNPNRTPSTIELLHQALEYLALGGKEDKRSLLEFIRKPGGSFETGVTAKLGCACGDQPAAV